MPSLKQRLATLLSIAPKVIVVPVEPELNPASQEVSDYLYGVVGVVEATSAEKQELWMNYAEEVPSQWRRKEEPCRFKWDSARSGYLPCVGRIGDRPVCISIYVDVVAGHRLLFWHATSELVDYALIEEWLTTSLPRSAFQGDSAYLNRTDATNFTNVFNRLDREEKIAA